MQTNTAGATPSKVTAPAITTPLQTDPEISQRALSPSQVTTWLGCRAAWYFKYALRLPDPPTVSLALGKAIHSTIASVLRAPKPKNDEQRVVHAGMAARQIVAEVGRELAEVPRDAMKDESISAIEGQALAMIEAVLPTLEGIHPVAVEEAITGEIAGVPLHAIIDARVPGEVIDFKTADRKPSGMKGNHRRQLATYAKLGNVNGAKLITITKTKTPAVIHQTMPPIEVHFEKTHIERLYPLVLEEMASGLYAPNRGSMFCSRHNCSFWSECQKEFGGIVEE